MSFTTRKTWNLVFKSPENPDQAVPPKDQNVSNDLSSLRITMQSEQFQVTLETNSRYTHF